MNLQGKWATLQRALADQHLTKADVAVFGTILDRADKDGFCWPARETIAADVGVSLPSVKRAIRTLEERGYIAIETASVGRGKSNLYKVLGGEKGIKRDPVSSNGPGPEKGSGVTPNDEGNGVKDDPRPENGVNGDPLPDGKGVKPDPEKGSGVTPEPVKEPIEERYTSTTTTSQDAPEPRGGEPATGIIAVFDRVLAEEFGANLRRPWPHATDLTTARRWWDAGVDLALCEHVFRVGMCRMAEAGDQPPRTLKFFDSRIAGELTARAKPLPEGGTNHGPRNHRGADRTAHEALFAGGAAVAAQFRQAGGTD